MKNLLTTGMALAGILTIASIPNRYNYVAAQQQLDINESLKQPQDGTIVVKNMLYPNFNNSQHIINEQNLSKFKVDSAAVINTYKKAAKQLH